MYKFLRVPFDTIHLVHSDNELVNSKRTHYVGVLLGLTSSYEGALEVISVYYQDCIVCLSCSCNHVWNKVSVAWRI